MFNSRLHQLANNASNIYHPASHLQGLAYQQHAHSHNTNIAHQHANTINNKSDRLIEQTPSPLPSGQSQPQDHLPATIQGNPVINNRDIHPKFRPWHQTRTNNSVRFSLSKSTTAVSSSHIPSILKNNLPLNQPYLADGRATVNTTKSSGLLPILSAKAQTRERISFVHYYFQQQLKAFFAHQHGKFPSSTRSNIKTGLR